MDLLKQLESKLQTLVQQRTQLLAELETLKAKGSGEADGLRAELAQVHSEREALHREREEVRERLEALLKTLEQAG